MVSFLLEKMKPKRANIFSIVMNVVSLVTMAFITYNQFQMVITKYQNKAASAILLIPHWVLVLILALGFLTLVLALFVKLMFRRACDHIMATGESWEAIPQANDSRDLFMTMGMKQWRDKEPLYGAVTVEDGKLY